MVGCGRVGQQLVKDFTRDGHTVSVVDRDPSAFARVPDDFPAQLIIGTGMDEDVLGSAGIEAADSFVAVTEDDNTNIMAAEIAHVIYKVPRVVVRIYDPERAEIYGGFGLDVICPTLAVARLIEERVLSAAPQPS